MYRRFVRLKRVLATIRARLVDVGFSLAYFDWFQTCRALNLGKDESGKSEILPFTEGHILPHKIAIQIEYCNFFWFIPKERCCCIIFKRMSTSRGNDCFVQNRFSKKYRDIWVAVCSTGNWARVLHVPSFWTGSCQKTAQTISNK